MKKSVVLVLLVTFVGFLYSFKTPESIVFNQNVYVSQSDTLDTTKYNHYLVHHKKGYTQSHFIPSTWDIYKWADNPNLGKVVKVDTLQVNVLWEDRN